MIGAPYADLQRGEAYILNGPADGEQAAADLDRISTTAAYAWVGMAVAAGDASGDGFDDLLVGSPNADAAYLFLGPVTASYDTSDAEATLVGTSGNRTSGQWVEITPDLDGDSLDDIVIGATHGGVTSTGWVYVAPAASTGDVDLDTEATYIFTGPSSGGLLGWATTDAGDVTGDGIDDLALGAVAAGSTNGLVYVMEGGVAPATYGAEADAYAIIEGGPQGMFGESMTTADYDEDGTPDLFVGDSYGVTADGDRAGVVYGFVGGISGSLVADADATVRWEAIAEEDRLATVRAGDVDADGSPDLVMGASYADGGAGAAYLQLGPAVGVVDVASLLSFAGVGEGKAGWSLALLSDWGGDGGDEIAISAHPCGWSDEPGRGADLRGAVGQPLLVSRSGRSAVRRPRIPGILREGQPIVPVGGRHGTVARRVARARVVRSRGRCSTLHRRLLRGRGRRRVRRIRTRPSPPAPRRTGTSRSPTTATIPATPRGRGPTSSATTATTTATERWTRR